MKESEFTAYYRDRYQKEVEWYDTKASKNKWRYHTAYTIIIISSAVTPILALSELKWPTTIAATLIAIASGIEKLMKFQVNWINYRTICETLRKEEHLMNAGLSDYAQTDSKQALFVERVENLISRENTLWISTTDVKKTGQDSSKK